MKRLVLIAMLAVGTLAKAQTFDAGGNGPAVAWDVADQFNYLGKPVAHYGLGWYSEAMNIPPYMYMSGYAGIKLFTWGEARMIIDGSGKVGIGTLTPSTKLEVTTSTDYDQIGLTKNTVEYYKGAGVIFRNLVDDGSTTEIGGVQARLLDGSTGNVTGSLSFYTKAGSSKVEAVTISGAGNMGIGTTNPSEKLAVNGKIRAREIKVEATNWPDYVFKAGYKVGTLEELESYIKANKHLPEIPSAKEVVENGVQLGEMNKLLLKKVEELTLHLIEKDKQLQHEDLAIKGQQQKIEALEKSHLELKQQLELLINQKNK
ncbi:hypothetical protein [Pedobacter kyungheensis]|uniref:hypothetical protein n=1 Tax=Pedobacter kyungheensis TaxID=1069985 RepID=UPI00068C8E0C|nr:hypothetical protein [Pedobacter kyungheensis]